MLIEALPQVVNFTWSVDALSSEEASANFYEAAIKNSEYLTSFGRYPILACRGVDLRGYVLDDDDTVVWSHDDGKAVFFSEVETKKLILPSKLKLLASDRKILSRNCNRQVSIERSKFLTSLQLRDLTGITKFLFSNTLSTPKSNAMTDRCQTTAGAEMWRKWVQESVSGIYKNSYRVLGIIVAPDDTTVLSVSWCRHAREVDHFLKSYFIGDNSSKELGRDHLVVIGRTS